MTPPPAVVSALTPAPAPAPGQIERFYPRPRAVAEPQRPGLGSTERQPQPQRTNSDKFPALMQRAAHTHATLNAASPPILPIPTLRSWFSAQPPIAPAWLQELP